MGTIKDLAVGRDGIIAGEGSVVLDTRDRSLARALLANRARGNRHEAFNRLNLGGSTAGRAETLAGGIFSSGEGTEDSPLDGLSEGTLDLSSNHGQN